MPTMTVIWWRDIPAQVTGRDGRRQSKIVLHPRFQVAIDKAASRAGKRSYDAYIEEWRRVDRPCGETLDVEVAAEVERLETEYDKHRLAQLIQAGGVEGGEALSPAHDETPGKLGGTDEGGEGPAREA
jgi:cvfA/B/C family virulence factor